MMEEGNTHHMMSILRAAVVLLLISFSNSFQKPPLQRQAGFCYSTGHLLRAFVDDTVDISPLNDGSVLKRIFRSGDVAKGLPQQKDIVEIAWKVYSKRDGTLLHDSRTMLGKPVPGYSNETENGSGTDVGWKVFTYEVGATPRQVIQGWEVGVQGMYEGEIAQLEIASHMAFGSKGVPPFIPENEDIVCELELVKILPTWRKTVRKAGENEHLREELIRKIQSGELPVSDQLKHRNPPNVQGEKLDSVSGSSEVIGGDAGRRVERTDRKFFNKDKHRVDPKLRIDGQAEGYRWSEDASSLEIEIPLDDTITKSDLSIQLHADRIDVAIRGSPTPLLRGPLHGRIQPSMSVWALIEESREDAPGTQNILQLSLEKSHATKEIWATVLDRGHLQQQMKNPSNAINMDDGEANILQ